MMERKWFTFIGFLSRAVGFRLRGWWRRETQAFGAIVVDAKQQFLHGRRLMVNVSQFAEFT